MAHSIFLMQAMAGISVGLSLFVVAVGLVIIFSVLKILNLAHGSLYMLGAYICFWMISIMMDNSALSFWAVLIIAPAIVALVGGLIERYLLRMIYGRAELYQFFLTFALSFVFGDVIRYFWGLDFHVVRKPAFLEAQVALGGLSLPIYNVFIICFGVALFIGLMLLIKKTKFGMIIRAVTTDREMMKILGVNVNRFYTLTFMLGCWLSGLAGALVAPMAVVAPSLGDSVLIQSFVIIVIGGFGSIPGALLGSIIYGLMQSFGLLILPRLAMIFPFILMAFILIFRPWGLLGKPIKGARH
jgi:branched-chain amino acid transport system permease protein